MSNMSNKEILNKIDNVFDSFQIEYMIDILKLRYLEDPREKKEILQKIKDLEMQNKEEFNSILKELEEKYS